MQAEPTSHKIFPAPQEERDEYLANFQAEYPTHARSMTEVCSCGRYLGNFGPQGGAISGFMYDWGVWAPKSHHGVNGCYPLEGSIQAECQGPYRKRTGVYVGCTNCEPYVRLVETRDSPYIYSVTFNEDLHMEVYDGDTQLEGVLEVMTGVGGYIIQVRKTPDAHMCPCYLAEEEEDIEPKVCRAYIPGNNYSVREPDDA